MSASQFLTFLKTIFKEASSKKFLVGIILGVSFSIAVILSTVGIMDGFSFTLKRALLKSGGELSVFSRMGFFDWERELSQSFKDLDITHYAEVIKTEAFLIIGDQSKGVVVKGIREDQFEKVTGLRLDISEGKIIVGSELLKSLSLSKSEEITLAFAKGNREISGLPLLKRFEIGGELKTGVYKKDLRTVFMRLEDLQNLLGVSDRINLVELNAPIFFGPDLEERTSQFEKILEKKLGHEFYVRPFWKEYSTLIDAVEVEKNMIGIILQLIVVISIFNVAAFIIFLNDQRAQEIFLYRAIGMGVNTLQNIWLISLSCMWGIACVGSIFLVKLFNYILNNATFFQLPGEIYSLQGLNIILDFTDYLMVFGLAFFWLLLISYPILSRMRKMSVVQGLRQEFS